MNYKALYEKQNFLFNQIIDDYKRRFKTIKKEIGKGGNDITLTRLGTKASEYQTFILELEIVQSAISALESEEHELIVPSEEEIDECFSLKDGIQRYTNDALLNRRIGAKWAIEQIKKLNK